MNPFNLPGPEFLLFYVVLAFTVIGVVALFRHSGEPEASLQPSLTDPYEIAYLRGGANEVLRLATVGLIDRKLLDVKGEEVKIADSKMADLVRHPVERAVLDVFRSSKKAASMFSNSSLTATCERYRKSLNDSGLIPNSEMRARALRRVFVAWAVLWLVAGLKIVIAVERGRKNVDFLIVIAIASSIIAVMVNHVKRTRRGDAFLEHMRSLMSSLKSRSHEFRPQKDTSELMLLGAVFGLASLPSGAFPYTKQLYPKADSSSSSSCGSSCGSSSDGGSSCGGGGCGGGCGGCGS